MQAPAFSPASAQDAPKLRLPWPCLSQGRQLFVLATRQGGRGQSLGRFLGAAFLAFGLLLLLAGTQKHLAPALASGGACVFTGLALLGSMRAGTAPLLALDGERNVAALCLRRFGRRAFRLFSLADLEIMADADGRRVHVRPRGRDAAGREIAGLPSGISDSRWRSGMALPAPEGDAMAAAAALEHWRRLAAAGISPLVTDACDAAEFTALLRKPLPPALLQCLSGACAATFPADAGRPDAGHDLADSPPRTLRRPSTPRPEIRRAPDLHDASGARDKRD